MHLLYPVLETQENKLVAQSFYCLACEAEARHMYCFSGVVVVAVVGGVNFYVFRSFSRKL